MKDITSYKMSQAMPEALAMEVYVLSAAMIDPYAIDRVADMLQPQHFYSEAHKAIYRSILLLRNDGKPVDLATIMEYLRRAGDLESIGGVAFLAELAANVTSSANIEAHSLVLLERWQRRQLISLSDSAGKMAFDPTIDILNTLENVAQSVTDTIDLTVEKTNIDDQINAFLENAERHYNNGGGMAGPALTGIEQLDKVLDGAAGGEVLILAGEPGTGKSSVANTAIANLINSGIPSLLWSGEMSAGRSLSRVIAAGTGINGRVIFKGGYHNENDYPDGISKVHAFTEKVAKSGTVFLENEMSLSRLVSVLSFYKRQGINIFFFDRIELFSTTEMKVRGDEAKTEIMSRIRSLATSLGIYIVVMAQMRKGVADNGGGRPTANDILGAGAISQSATQIVFTYSPEKYGVLQDQDGNSTKGMVELIVEKNTNGEANVSIPVYFNRELTLMSENPVKTWKPNFLSPVIEIGEQPYNPNIEAGTVSGDEDIPF